MLLIYEQTIFLNDNMWSFLSLSESKYTLCICYVFRMDKYQEVVEYVRHMQPNLHPMYTIMYRRPQNINENDNSQKTPMNMLVIDYIQAILQFNIIFFAKLNSYNTKNKQYCWPVGIWIDSTFIWKKNTLMLNRCDMKTCSRAPPPVADPGVCRRGHWIRQIGETAWGVEGRRLKLGWLMGRNPIQIQPRRGRSYYWRGI